MGDRARATGNHITSLTNNKMPIPANIPAYPGVHATSQLSFTIDIGTVQGRATRKNTIARLAMKAANGPHRQKQANTIKNDRSKYIKLRQHIGSRPQKNTDGGSANCCPGHPSIFVASK
jgi:hypothetical protein